MFNGADVPELDSSHPLHKQQEVQECDADLLRGVMKVVLEEGEEVAQERMAQPILQHQTQTLVCGRVGKGEVLCKSLVYSCSVTGKESLPNTNAHS